jgi:hypothetical protein
MRSYWGRRGRIAVLPEAVVEVHCGFRVSIGCCLLWAYEVAQLLVHMAAAVAVPDCIHTAVEEESVVHTVHSCCTEAAGSVQIGSHNLAVVGERHSSAEAAGILGAAVHRTAAVEVRRRSCCGTVGLDSTTWWFSSGGVSSEAR